MLGHVPFGDIFLTAVEADKRSQALMLPHVDIEVTTCVILFVATLVGAMKLVDILVCFFVVSEYPMLSELREAPWIRAHKLFVFFFFVGGHMVGKMLRHFKTLGASWVCTFVEPYR
jgi:hypothetical protein